MKTDDNTLAAILAVGAMLVFGILVGVLLFWTVPEKNQQMLSVVVGFLAGNMVGPVYRKLFGGADTDTKAAQAQASSTLAAVVDKLPGAPS